MFDAKGEQVVPQDEEESTIIGTIVIVMEIAKMVNGVEGTTARFLRLAER